MALALMLGALLLWLTFGTSALRDRRNWAGFGAMLIGLALLAKGRPFIGVALIAGGAAWLRRPRRRPGRAADAMALADARALLGLSANADRDAILAAHRRLIARNHPDNGGTEALAAQLNAARDLLLKTGEK